MTLELATDVEVFATERGKVQVRHEKELLGSAKYALRHFGSKGWANALIERAERLVRQQYHADTDRWTSPALRRAQRSFRKQVTDMLTKTEEPTDDHLDAQAALIARSLSVAAVNLAIQIAAADSPEKDIVLVWVSMEDAKVRPTHVKANGQRRPLGEKFDVGGVEMTRPGDLTAPIEEWVNCRCVLAVMADEGSVAASLTAATTKTPGGDMPDTDEMLDEIDEIERAMGEAAPPEEVPWYGVLAPEDTPSGDGRKFGAEALRWRDLPLPLKWQPTDLPGHDGSVIVGRIDDIWRDGSLVRAKGVFIDSEQANEAIGLMAQGALRGVSVDADDGTMEMQTKDGERVEDLMEAMEPDSSLELDLDELVEVYTSARVCSATLCAIPAFAEAFLTLGVEGETDEELLDESEPVEVDPEVDELDALAASVIFAPGTEDGPGWLTHPVDTDRLRDYWVRGKGAAKIGWGVPGDFNRCRAHLAKYVKPMYLNGYCANRHKDALGFWPGEHRGGRHSAETPVLSLVAAADLNRPPAGWFENPNLTDLFPFSVTDEGQVFGYLAGWGTCHIGISGACVTPPPSRTNYAHFRTKSVVVDSGETIPVGVLTMDTGHADISAKARPAAAHYDNTGTVTCDVVIGEDERGIWVAGAVRPDTPPEKIRAIRGSVLSGDWREIGGALELVAALHVNVGGFPVPHPALAASGGRQLSLVAAGIVMTAAGEQVSASTVREIVEETLRAVADKAAAKKHMEDLASRAYAEQRRQMAAVAARASVAD